LQLLLDAVQPLIEAAHVLQQEVLGFLKGILHGGSRDV
jgi:hypothetical protein